MNNKYTVIKKGVRYVVELKIDFEGLAIEMVNRAARNPSGKASIMHGAIVAKVIEKEPAK